MFLAYDPLYSFLEQFSFSSSDVEKFIHFVVLLLFSTVVMQLSLRAYEFMENKYKKWRLSKDKA